MKVNAKLESATRPYDIVSCHNDWPAANILDAGARPWLIDWDRGGFNSPLFDLGGLAANNSLNEATEQTLLEVYYNARLAAPLLCHESRQPNVRSPVEHAF